MSADNPYHYGASHILQRLEQRHLRTELYAAARDLLMALGSPVDPQGMDDGTLALAIMCTFLREHGGTIHTLTQAHNELHAP